MAVLALLFLGIYFGFFYKNHLIQSLPESPNLKRVECWFSEEMQDEYTECYYVRVPENHDAEESKLIEFPLVIFRSPFPEGQPPVLHLGAGGPGAPMYFDDDYVVHYLQDAHDGFSTEVGRDLYVIDPRGTGLSRPLLNCRTFVNNLPERLAQNLTQREDWNLSDADFLRCVQDFHAQGVDLTQYHSMSVAKDLEFLREILQVERWTLVGVSYAAIYAQTYARLFPESVEAMILDSAAFPNLKLDNRFIERSLAPYHALYNYCDADASCSRPLENFVTRLWALYDKLNLNPVTLEISHPHNGETLQFLLNGDRFIATLIDAIYGEDIFTDLPHIVEEMEQGKHDRLLSYIEDYAVFLFDVDYGDISASAHYCYDDKPFIDFAALEPLIDDIPEEAIQESLRLSIEWPDLCEQMGEFQSDPSVASPLVTDIPTLFLNGTLDAITPIADVLAQQQNFSRSHLATFAVSHSVLGTDEKVENLVADFLDDFEVTDAK